MEIQSLKALLTEQDLNDLTAKHLTDELPVKDVIVTISPDGIVVKGVYPMFFKVKFELTWVMGVRDAKVSAQLTQCKAFGVPGPMVKNMVMKAVNDAVKKEDALNVQGDTVLVDVDGMLAKNGLTAKTNLVAVACRTDGLWIEAEKS